jgi:hypothetical protein
MLGQSAHRSCPPCPRRRASGPSRTGTLQPARAHAREEVSSERVDGRHPQLGACAYGVDAGRVVARRPPGRQARGRTGWRARSGAAGPIREPAARPRTRVPSSNDARTAADLDAQAWAGLLSYGREKPDRREDLHRTATTDLGADRERSRHHSTSARAAGSRRGRALTRPGPRSCCAPGRPRMISPRPDPPKRVIALDLRTDLHHNPLEPGFVDAAARKAVEDLATAQADGSCGTIRARPLRRIQPQVGVERPPKHFGRPWTRSPAARPAPAPLAIPGRPSVVGLRQALLREAQPSLVPAPSPLNSVRLGIRFSRLLSPVAR